MDWSFHSVFHDLAIAISGAILYAMGGWCLRYFHRKTLAANLTDAEYARKLLNDFQTADRAILLHGFNLIFGITMCICTGAALVGFALWFDHKLIVFGIFFWLIGGVLSAWGMIVTSCAMRYKESKEAIERRIAKLKNRLAKFDDPKTTI